MHARQLNVAVLERGKKAAVWLTGDPEDGEKITTHEEALAAIDAMCRAAEDLNNKAKGMTAAPAVQRLPVGDIGAMQSLVNNFTRYAEHAQEKCDKASLRGTTLEGEWNRGRAVAYRRCATETAALVKK